MILLIRDAKGLALVDVDPVAAAAYVEALGRELSVPSVRVHLSALRNVCDYLVTGGALEWNPFAPVRAPRHVTTTGKTPVLHADDARRLLDSIDTSTLIGLRDRAIIAVMLFAFARVGAVVQLRVRDYEAAGRRKAFLALREKGGKFNRVPVHHAAMEALDAYLDAAELGGGRNSPLFRSADRRRQGFTKRPLLRNNVLAMVRRRAAAAGLDPASVCNHTFRATGITSYMENGGRLEVAAQIAGHASTRTTQLYNRHRDVIGQEEIERIRI